MINEMDIDFSELLQTPQNICLPDPRQEPFTVSDEATDTGRKINSQDYYFLVNEVRLGDNVPGKIRAQFEIARNLIIYSWFMYRFAAVAELQAFYTLEFALKEKAALCCISNRGYGLKRLLNLAINEGWIKDRDFPGFSEMENISDGYIRYLSGIAQTEPVEENERDSQVYFKVVKDIFPGLGILMAHGSSDLAGPGNVKENIRVCAEIINQLFP